MSYNGGPCWSCIEKSCKNCPCAVAESFDSTYLTAQWMLKLNGDEFNSIEDVLNNFEDDGSFGGEIWACYDEWQDSEFFEELCDRIRDKVRIDWVEDTEDLVFHTPVDGHEDVVLYHDGSHDDWGEIVAEFILYGDYATNEKDESEKFRSILITWLWLNDEKGNAY